VTTEPGTSLAYRDGNFLKVIIAFEWEIGGEKVCRGRGGGIFIIIENRYVEK
jgi:hypothetical protein